ncbi:MAG: hypothetical protein KJ709_00365 [Nanoarchaeota archaeon]|nr:hypothetical protein [Nanoarchaeota archaeon]
MLERMERLFKKHTQMSIAVSVGAVVLLFLLIFFVIRPGVIGYETYQTIQRSNYSIEDYGHDIVVVRQNLSSEQAKVTSCEEFNRDLLLKIEQNARQYSGCRSELSTLMTNYSFTVQAFEGEIDELEADLEERLRQLNVGDAIHEEELDSMQNDYDELAKNTANNLCCKQKIDNSDISHYEVANNRVVCLTEGLQEISC